MQASSRQFFHRPAPAVLASAIIVCTSACDPVQFPEGPSGLLVVEPDASLINKTPGEPYDTVITTEDNPQVFGTIAARPGLSASYLEQNGKCDPFADTDKVDNYTNCREWFNATDTVGHDQLTVWSYRGDFESTLALYGIFANGYTTKGNGVYSPWYDTHAQTALYFQRDFCPEGDCSKATYPWMIPRIHLPLDGAGNVNPVYLELLLTENSSGRQIGRPLKIVPDPRLIVVPIHYHLFRDNIDASTQYWIAADIGKTFDDPGPVRPEQGDVYKEGWFGVRENSASLRRPALSALDRLGTERVFHECGVQLRAVSIQFHPREAALLENGRINAHCGRLGQHGCKQIDCAPFLASSGLGATASRFAGEVAGLGLPQGLHILEMDGAVFDGFGDQVGEGYGCASENGSIAFGIVQQPTGDREATSLAMHEISHALGVWNELAVERTINLGEPWGTNCDDIRREAAKVVALSP